MNKLVSIIIPTFNRAHLIAETLDSIIDQDYQNWECIVVDDGSDDKTEDLLNEYIKKDSRFSFYRRPDNWSKGVGICRNFGFEISKGDFINFVDSDDVLTTNHLSLHIDILIKNNIDCSVTNSKTFIGNIQNLGPDWSNINTQGDIIFDMIKNDVLWAIGAVVWKRESLNAKPFIDELTNSEEWAFHLLQILDNKKYFIENQTTYLARRHSDRVGKSSNSLKHFSTFKSRVYLLKKLILKNQNTKSREFYLLKDIFVALRYAIKDGFKYTSRKIIWYLILNFFSFNNKWYVFKNITVAVPIYSIFKKGEKLFKI